MKWPVLPAQVIWKLRSITTWAAIDRVDAGRKSDLIETVAFQLVQKIFESHAFVESSSGAESPGLLFPAIVETCSVTPGENGPLLGLAPIWGDKQLQLEIVGETQGSRHSPSSDIHKDWNRTLGRSGAGVFWIRYRSWNLDDPRGFIRPTSLSRKWDVFVRSAYVIDLDLLYMEGHHLLVRAWSTASLCGRTPLS